MNKRRNATTHGAERGLSRFEGFSDAVFAIALTLVIVEIKVPGSPEGPQGYTVLAKAMAEQWREHMALLLAIVAIPYPIRAWCFHVGTSFEPTAAVSLTVGLALTASIWMAKWFYGLQGRRVMDPRLAPDFLGQMTRRYSLAALLQIVAVPMSIFLPRSGVALGLLCVAFFLLPQPKPRYIAGEEPSEEERLKD
jgi:hypothetical protein